MYRCSPVQNSVFLPIKQLVDTRPLVAQVNRSATADQNRSDSRSHHRRTDCEAVSKTTETLVSRSEVLVVALCPKNRTAGLTRKGPPEM